MKQYLDLLQYILDKGVPKADRTGTGTLSIFGHQSRYDLNKGFPIVTTKKMFLKGVIHELLWFLNGDTNVKYLNEHDVHIWDEWTDANGYLGPIYGSQWRKWQGFKFEPSHNVGSVWVPEGYSPFYIDQIHSAIELIKNNPDSRRIIVSAWNVADLKNMAIEPCHCLFQFYVVNDILSCQLYQRSCDVFLGVPFNIASYALLTMMIAQVTNKKLGDFIHTYGDVHIYNNHLEQVELQLTRTPFALPQMQINPEVKNIGDFKYEDFDLVNYSCYPAIKAPISV